MAKQQRSKLASGPLPQRMTFAGGSSGVLDQSTVPLPPTSLESWFADAEAVAKFSQPVRPRV
jgi:hypothetical protein